MSLCNSHKYINVIFDCAYLPRNFLQRNMYLISSCTINCHQKVITLLNKIFINSNLRIVFDQRKNFQIGSVVPDVYKYMIYYIATIKLAMKETTKTMNRILIFLLTEDKPMITRRSVTAPRERYGKTNPR